MSIGPISNLPFSYLESFLGLGANNKTASAAAASQSATPTFAQILEQLGQLQQANPAQYQQVISQISALLGPHSQQPAGVALSSLHQSLAAFNNGKLQNIALDPMGIIARNL